MVARQRRVVANKGTHERQQHYQTMCNKRTNQSRKSYWAALSAALLRWKTNPAAITYLERFQKIHEYAAAIHNIYGWSPR